MPAVTPNPIVAVCIPWRQRFPADAEILSWVVGYWRALHPGWAVIVSDMDLPAGSIGDRAPAFNRSAARNACARRAIEGGARVLVFANADTVPILEWRDDVALEVHPDPLDEAVRRAFADPDGWDLSACYVEASQGWTEDRLREAPAVLREAPAGADVERTLSAAPGQLGKPYAGLIVVPAVLHERVGGWDEGYGAGWGWEDTAYVDGLAAISGAPPPRSGTVVHLWHERRPEDHPAHPAARRNRRRWAEQNRSMPSNARRRR